MAPFGLKLWENAFQTIPDISSFDVEKNFWRALVGGGIKIFVFFGFRFFRLFIDCFLKFQNSIGQGWVRPRNGGRPRRVGTAVGHGGAPALAN